MLPLAVHFVARTCCQKDIEGCDVKHGHEKTDHHPGNLDGPQEGKVVIHEAPAHPDANDHRDEQNCDENVEDCEVECIPLQAEATHNMHCSGHS